MRLAMPFYTIPPDSDITDLYLVRVFLSLTSSKQTGPYTLLPIKLGIFSVLPAGPNLVGSVKVNILFSSNFMYEPFLRLLDFLMDTNSAR